MNDIDVGQIWEVPQRRWWGRRRLVMVRAVGETNVLIYAVKRDRHGWTVTSNAAWVSKTRFRQIYSFYPDPVGETPAKSHVGDR